MTNQPSSIHSTGQLFDLQVNGYGGVDFNSDALTIDDVSESCAALRADGVSGFLATVITDDIDRMCSRIRRLVAARESDRNVATMIQGIHIEGPFISPLPGYVGTHPARAVRSASPELARELCDAADGLARIVTLAPEMDPTGATIRWLADQGICVSAGHCDPTLEQLDIVIDCGLKMFTHLGNGCPLELPRHDNIIQRVLHVSRRLWVSFIADGIHIPYFALQNLLKAVGLDRAIVVSDAIAAAGLGPGTYQLAGQQVLVDGRLATWSTDRTHLMGAATPLAQARTNLVRHLGLTVDQAEQLTVTNPRCAIADARNSRRA